MAVSSGASKTVIIGFWLALGFALFAFAMKSVKRVSAKAGPLTADAKKDFVN